MRVLTVLAMLLLPSLGWAGTGSDPLDWRISGGFRPGTGNDQVVLVVAGQRVTSKHIRNYTTLYGTHQGHDIAVRCHVLRSLLVCDVSADGNVLKTVYFDPSLLR